jgi:uncharacterized delta-60 repeat protein
MTDFSGFRRRGVLLPVALAWAVASPWGDVANAAAGDLDHSFGGDGKVLTNLTPGFDFAGGVDIQADGKIVAAGMADGSFGLVRYRINGTLDSSFGGGDGWVTTDFGDGPDWATDVAIQGDGRIVAAGTAGFNQFAVARYDAQGALDTEFGGDGKVITSFSGGSREEAAQGVVVQPDGRVVVAGWSWSRQSPRFALARYETDGSLDPTFGGNGKVITNFDGCCEHAQDLALQANGKIVVVGTAGPGFGVARYRKDGSLDAAFSGDGMVTTSLTPPAWSFDWANAVAIQPDGKIVAAGEAGSPYYGLTSSGGDEQRRGGQMAVVRYMPNGTLDPAFGGDGKVMTNLTPKLDTANDVAIQPNGKIVAAGTAGEGEPPRFDSKFVVVRYHPGGGRDAGFSGDGKAITNFTPSFEDGTGAAIQADGNIVVAGRAAGNGSRFALVRYLAA